MYLDLCPDIPPDLRAANFDSGDVGLSHIQDASELLKCSFRQECLWACEPCGKASADKASMMQPLLAMFGSWPWRTIYMGPLAHARRAAREARYSRTAASCTADSADSMEAAASAAFMSCLTSQCCPDMDRRLPFNWAKALQPRMRVSLPPARALRLEGNRPQTLALILPALLAPKAQQLRWWQVCMAGRANRGRPGGS